jgi:hypothetical protein
MELKSDKILIKLCTSYGSKKRSTQRKHIRSGGAYSFEEIKSLTLDDGTRVVTSVDGDMKRQVCAGIDVHKEILLAVVCRTAPDTLTADFYVRKFQSTNSDIRRMGQWFKDQGVQDVCMESTVGLIPRCSAS